MGWASYFENVCDHHHGKASDGCTPSIIGPAGGTVQTRRPTLAGTYRRLREIYENIGGDFVRSYEEEQWRALSTKMDHLEEQVASFHTRTLLAGEQAILIDAGDLSRTLQTTLSRAKMVISYLDSLLMDLFTELEEIQALKQVNPSLNVSDDNAILEQNGVWLFHGWKALRFQAQGLEEKADDLQVQIAGDVLKRLTANPRTRTPLRD